MAVPETARASEAAAGRALEAGAIATIEATMNTTLVAARQPKPHSKYVCLPGPPLGGRPADLQASVGATRGWTVQIFITYMRARDSNVLRPFLFFRQRHKPLLLLVVLLNAPRQNVVIPAVNGEPTLSFGFPH